MARLPNLTWLATLLVGVTLVFGRTLSAEEGREYRVAVFAPQVGVHSEKNDYARLFAEDLEKHWSRALVEPRYFPLENQGDPEAVSRTLVELAQDSNLRGVVLGEAPGGSVDGVARLRARRPDIFVIALDPHEDLVKMSRVATLTVALNHPARGVTYPTMAHRMGARSLVFFSFPRHQAMSHFSRQHRIISQVTRDLGMILVSDLHAPDPLANPDDRAAIEGYLEKAVDRYLRQYGENTAFMATSNTYGEILASLVRRKGGCALEAVQPSLVMGYPEALGLEREARELFGQWRKLLAVEDEKFMALDPPGKLSAWTYPYPHTAMLAMVDIVISAIDQKADIYDLKNVNAALEKYSPGAKWLVSPHTDYAADAVIPQVALVLQDTYWFAHGYQGFNRLNIPSKYYRIQ